MLLASAKVPTRAFLLSLTKPLTLRSNAANAGSGRQPAIFLHARAQVLGKGSHFRKLCVISRDPIIALTFTNSLAGEQTSRIKTEVTISVFLFN